MFNLKTKGNKCEKNDDGGGGSGDGDDENDCYDNDNFFTF